MEISDLVQRFSDTPQHQRKAIFSQLMIAATRLQTVFDQEIPQVTLKQFMLLTIVRQSDSELTLEMLFGAFSEAETEQFFKLFVKLTAGIDALEGERR